MIRSERRHPGFGGWRRAWYPAILAGIPSLALAGPPFLTDDPEPVDYQHGELNLGIQGTMASACSSGMAPHIEANDGILPDVQLHLIGAGMAFDHPSGDTAHYGYGDSEVGVKWRSLQESDHLPHICIYPNLELPTGNKDLGLGSGHPQVFLPLWLQKSCANWKTYGGGGYWINPGVGNRDDLFLGWEAQYQVTPALAIGGEVFHDTPSTTDDAQSRTGFNLGGIYDFNETYHLLLSAGRDVTGTQNRFSGYLALQCTL